MPLLAVLHELDRVHNAIFIFNVLNNIVRCRVVIVRCMAFPFSNLELMISLKHPLLLLDFSASLGLPELLLMHLGLALGALPLVLDLLDPFLRLSRLLLQSSDLFFGLTSLAFHQLSAVLGLPHLLFRTFRPFMGLSSILSGLMLLSFHLLGMVAHFVPHLPISGNFALLIGMDGFQLVLKSVMHLGELVLLFYLVDHALVFEFEGREGRGRA